MFDIERWREIFSSLKNNMLRVILSGSTVALGLYIFIVLLGIGKGLQNSFTDSFNSQEANIIRISGGRTSIAYKGMQAYRHIFLSNEDFEDILKKHTENINYATAYTTVSAKVKYGKENGDYTIYGANPDEKYIENRRLLQGRYFNALDAEKERRVAVIGKMIQRDLIKNGNAIGKYLDINGVMFRVIGVSEAVSKSDDRSERRISVPLNVIQQVRKNTDTLNSIAVAYDPNLPLDEAEKLGNQIEDKIMQKNKISPDDVNAVYLRNGASQQKGQRQFMYVLTIIVGVIGLGTLIAGVISISNIMIYTVKERTKEIGIRKAIGARPFSIVVLILQESILVTVIFGLFGIFSGLLTIKLTESGLKEYSILNPSVDNNIIFFAFVSLVISGLLAGFFPAYKASKIKPIQALQQE